MLITLSKLFLILLIDQIIDHDIPTKKVSNKDQKLSIKPWITNDISFSI